MGKIDWAVFAGFIVIGALILPQMAWWQCFGVLPYLWAGQFWGKKYAPPQQKEDVE